MADKVKKLKDKMKANKNTSISSHKERIQKNYNKKLWSNNMLRIAVKKGELTSSEFEEITGETYVKVNTKEK